MVDTDLPLIEFTALDRCDRCGAQAYTLAKRDDMPADLMFCIHHSKRYRESLMDEGWTIVDDYEAIERLTKPKFDGAPV